MSKISRRGWLGMTGAVAAAGGLSLLPAGREARAAAERPSPRALLAQRNFPNVELTTHEGEKVRFYDDLIKDKLVAINIVYTTCKATCPLSTANLVRVQKLFGDRVGRDFFMYSLTIDPKRDTVKVLNQYAKTFGVGKGWKFLTGAPKDVDVLRRRLGFAWADPAFDRDPDSHTGNLKYGNEPLMLWGAVPAQADPAWIKECITFADRSRPGHVHGA